MKKTERLLTLVLALRHYGRRTAAQLAELTGVNIRTIYRDMDALSQMEIPLIALTGTDGGYEITDNYFLPAVQFTREEVLALLVAKKLVDAVHPPGFSPHVEAAFLKLRNIMKEEEKTNLERALNRILFQVASVVPEKRESEYFQEACRAFLEGRTLQIRYFSPKKLSESSREIEPRVLFYSDGAWYLVAYCLERKAERTFRLDRIQKLSLTSNSYSIPDDFDLIRYDDIEDYKRDSRSTKDAVNMTIRMKRTFYEQNKHRLLFKFQDVQVQDESCLFRINTAFPQEYINFSIRHCEAVEILEPPEIRKKLMETVENQYQFIKKRYS